VDPLIGGHGRCGVNVSVVWGACFRALCQGEHEDGPKTPSQEAEHPGSEVSSERLADLVTEEMAPVLLVPPLGGREREEDFPLFSAATSREVAVHGGLGAFIR
jgi:hypothetical protein